MLANDGSFEIVTWSHVLERIGRSKGVEIDLEDRLATSFSKFAREIVTLQIRNNVSSLGFRLSPVSNLGGLRMSFNPAGSALHHP